MLLSIFGQTRRFALPCSALSKHRPARRFIQCTVSVHFAVDLELRRPRAAPRASLGPTGHRSSRNWSEKKRRLGNESECGRN